MLITAAGNVQVAGCFIGTDPTGEVAEPNGNGVRIENSSNTIGGPDVGDRNVISGNGNDGVEVRDSALNPQNITADRKRRSRITTSVWTPRGRRPSVTRCRVLRTTGLAISTVEPHRVRAT